MCDFATCDCQTHLIYKLYSYLKVNILTAVCCGICLFLLFLIGRDDLITNETVWVSIILVLNVPIFLDSIIKFLQLGF